MHIILEHTHRKGPGGRGIRGPRPNPAPGLMGPRPSVRGHHDSSRGRIQRRMNENAATSSGSSQMTGSISQHQFPSTSHPSSSSPSNNNNNNNNNNNQNGASTGNLSIPPSHAPPSHTPTPTPQPQNVIIY